MSCVRQSFPTYLSRYLEGEAIGFDSSAILQRIDAPLLLELVVDLMLIARYSPHESRRM